MQGVSTRKVTALMGELCGLEVSSTQVSRAALLLNEELERWRNRLLGEVPYVFQRRALGEDRHWCALATAASFICSRMQSLRATARDASRGRRSSLELRHHQLR